MFSIRALSFAICGLALGGTFTLRAQESLPSLESPAEANDQRTPLERYYKGYVERAKAEGKDLLIVLYNSKRLTPEKKDVLTSAAWQEKVLSRVVPIEIDLRDEIVKDPEALAPIEALLQQFQLKGGPAVMALDAQGHSFGQVSFKKQSADEFIKDTANLFVAKQQRDTVLAEAAELEVKQVKLLDQAVEGLLKLEADLSNYRDTIDKIIDLDNDDKAGVKTKYRALAALYDAEHLLLNNQYDEGMKVMRAIDGSLLPEALKRNRDERLIRMYFLTSREADAEKYVKELLANKAVSTSYKQDIAAFLGNRFKAEPVKATAWLKAAIALDKDSAGVAAIQEKLKAIEELPKAEADSAAEHHFAATDNNAPFSVGSLKGKVAVLVFWNNSQKGSLATLAELRKEFNGEVACYAINSGDSVESAQAYLKQAKLDVNSAFDPDRSGASAFGIRHFPMTLIVAKDGTLQNGPPALTPLNKDSVKKQIEALRK